LSDSSSVGGLTSDFQNLLSALGTTSGSSSGNTNTQLQTFLQSLASNLQQQGASSASGMFVNTAA